MKRITASIFAAVLCASVLLGGCGDSGSTPASNSSSASEKASSTAQESSSETGASVNLDEHLELDLMAYFVMDVTKDDDILKMIGEKFNCTINPAITNIANYNQTLQMKVAAGEVPDWFRITDSSLQSQLAADGALLNISEYTQKYGFSNIQNTLDEPLAYLLQNDGDFYVVPDNTGHLTAGLYVRKDWMEALSLEVPKTWEEFRTFLQAMVEADLDGNGTTGYTTYGNGFSYFLPCWTGYNAWAYIDGTLTSQNVDPMLKEFLKYWSSLYTDKLMDPEQFTNSYEQAMQKFDTGRAGVLSMNLVQIWWDANESPMKQYKPDAKMGSIVPIPAGPEGSCVFHSLPYFANSAFSADMSEDKKARCLAVMDYLLGEEGSDLTLYGIEGKHHTVQDGKLVQNTETVNKEWGQNLHFIGEIANFGNAERLTHSEGVLDYLAYLDQPDVMKYNYAQFFSSDETTKYGAQVNEVYNAYMTSFLTGEKDIDAEWDNYVAELNAAGQTELTKLTEQFFKDNGLEDKVPHITR